MALLCQDWDYILNYILHLGSDLGRTEVRRSRKAARKKGLERKVPMFASSVFLDGDGLCILRFRCHSNVVLVLMGKIARASSVFPSEKGCSSWQLKAKTYPSIE